MTTNKTDLSADTSAQLSLVPLDDYVLEHTCVVCLDIMVRPHVLQPCGHTFCELCLRQLQQVAVKSMLNSKCILVPCPICRRSIEKCELICEKDDTIRSKYPSQYKERLQDLVVQQQKHENSELPRARYPAPARAPVASTQRPAPVVRAQTRNQRRPPFHGNSVAKHICSVVIVVSVYGLGGTYLICVATSLGLLKFCYRLVGKNGHGLTPPRGEGTLRVRWVRGISLMLFLAAVRSAWTLSWWKTLLLFPSVLSISIAGYALDGNGFTMFQRALDVAMLPHW
ncbi:E3 ubiquitin-protein ligase rnf180 [Plakobranchus ocellatus]|uniref:E3 ubiquitin-protein ligase rnf180 n=1 Tax=Plakobranchus ocellatus TaxID=259542 RepID=A0AAV4DWK7_9GAST|nr:E3 ubiquitin-protein ligase rnf180 [Plakobranchus ocellatus]